MKKLLSLVLSVILIMMLFSFPVANAEEGETDPYDITTAKIDWRKYEGTELNAMFIQHWLSDDVVERVGEFEELTGIKVNFELIPESDYVNKLLIEFASGTNPPDIYMENFAYVAAHYAGGWVQDLNEFIDNPELTDPDFFRFDLFMPTAIDFATYKGILSGLPVTGEWQVLIYNKELFEQKGVEVPTTFDELYDAAVKLNDPENNISGIVGRMKRAVGSANLFAGYMYGMGGSWITVDDNGKATINVNNPGSIKAADYFGKLYRDGGPMGAVNYGYAESVAEMQSGHAAMFVDQNGFRGQIEDPELSAVIGKIGYAPYPVDPDHEPMIPYNHWFIGMASQSTNKEAAWYFLQWVTSLKVAESIAMEEGNGARSTIWDNPEFIEKYGADYIEACKFGSDHGYKNVVPQIVSLPEAMDSMETALHAIYAGDGDAAYWMPIVEAETQAVLDVKG